MQLFVNQWIFDKEVQNISSKSNTSLKKHMRMWGSWTLNWNPQQLVQLWLLRFLSNTKEPQILVPNWQPWRVRAEHPFAIFLRRSPKPESRILTAEELNFQIGVCSSSLCLSLVSFSFLFQALVMVTMQSLLINFKVGHLHLLPQCMTQ